MVMAALGHKKRKKNEIQEMTTCTYASLIQIRNGIVVSYTAYCIDYTPQTKNLRYLHIL